MNQRIDMRPPGRDGLSPGLPAWRFRPRSHGVLTAAEIAWCRANGVALAYDPVQIGWVPLDCEDDIDPAAEAPRPGRSCSFRPWRAEDAPVLARMLSSPRLWRHLPERSPGPVDAAFAADLIALGNGSGHQDVRAIEHAGEIVGQVRLLFAMDGDDRPEAEISYWLDEAHWGRGIGSAAVAAFTALSFRERPGLKRLFARVHVENAPSRRILEKAGYRLRAAPPQDGVWLFLDIDRPSLG